MSSKIDTDESFNNIKKNKWKLKPLSTIFEDPNEEDIKEVVEQNKLIHKGDPKWDPDVIFKDK